MTVREIREKQQRLATEAQAMLDSITGDMDEGRQAELNEQADKIFAEFDQLDARATREERAADMVARLNAPDPRRPVGDSRSASGREQSGVTTDTAFNSYLVNGLNGMAPEERSMMISESRAMNVGTNSAGGFTVPTTLANEIIKSLKMWGPMLDPGVTRQLVTNAGETINWPTMDDTATVAAIIGENAEVTTPGAVAFGQKSLGAFKYTTGLIKVSMELAQDNIVNLQAVIREAMAERLGRGVNAHLTTGAGTSVPWGLVTRSALGYTKPLVGVGAAGVPVLDFDAMIELLHSVDPAYRNHPSVGWQFNDDTLKRLRKVKDQDDNYIWQPASVAGEQPATILGKRYDVNQAMANVVFDARPIVFGAMDRYIVRRVRELSIARLDERYAEFGQIAFIGFARFDGELMDTAAVKHMVIPSDPS